MQKKVIEDLFTEYVYTTKMDDLELYDLVAFLHPIKGYIVVTRYFGREGNALIFHNITVPADKVEEFYIIARPLHQKEKKKSLWTKASKRLKLAKRKLNYRY